MTGIDDAGPVREEDAFDVDAVTTWLAGQGVELGGRPEVRQFAGGASNLTYSLRTPTHDLILRRPPPGQKARGAHDMGREYLIQTALAGPFRRVPEMVAFCDDASVLGSDFYVMRRVDGLIPRRDLPPGADLDEDGVHRLCRNAVDVLIDLHAVDPASSPALTSLDRGHGYVERQIAGWSRRFRDARTDDVEAFEDVMAWLDAHRPDDVGTCVIHNDFRFDNLVLDRADPTRVVAVLDWEMATLGDPLMDLGGTLAYWVTDGDDAWFREFRRQPTHLPGMFTRPELVAYYCERTGLDPTPEQLRFYEAYGLFRLAVICQQIYYRYFHGQTHNEAYARFGPAAQRLGERCRALVLG